MTTGQSTNRGVAKVECSPDDTLPDSAPLAPPTPVFPQHFNRIEFLTNEYAHLADTLRYRSEELQSVVRDIKQLPEYKFGAKCRNTRPCERCPKLAYQNRCQEILNRKLLSLTNKLVQIVPQNHASYKACVKELHELSKLASFKKEQVVTNDLTEPDETVVVESLTKRESRIGEAVAIKPTKLTHRPEETLVNATPKLTSHIAETDPNERSTIVTCAGGENLELSPVIEQCGNNKRRKKSISTKNRNKVEDVRNTIGHNSDSEFPGFDRNPSKSRAETPDFIDMKNCVTPFDNIDDLTTPTSTREPSLNSIEDIIEPTQKLPSRRSANFGRRTLTFGKPNLDDATIEQLPEKCAKTAPGKTSPLNIIIKTSSNHTVNSFASTTKSPMKSVKAKKADEGDESVFKNPKAQADEIKKKNPEMKWNFAQSRQPTNSKLKQTLLSATTFQKKVDTTKQEKFNGGLQRFAETKETGDENLPSNKKSDENCLSSAFESTITSTVNDMVKKTPVKKGKAERW